MNPARRLAWYVAYNVNMAGHDPSAKRRQTWMPDPLVPEELQPGQKHFVRSGYDRGHLAPRYLLMWGDHREAQIASHQAFFWTNTGPQHPALNRANYFAVERWERRIAQRYGRLVGFAGPSLRGDDPPFRDEEMGEDGFVAHGTYRIPQAYWKVVVVLDARGRLVHRAFWFRNRNPDETVTVDHRAKSHAIEIGKLQELTGLEFPAEILDAPVLDG